jgi:TolB protein
MYPSWSPDGQWIAFFSTREGGGYFVMPGVGGSARRVASWLPPADEYPTAAQWSPDSTQLAFARDQRVGPSIEILTLASGAARKLPLPARPRSNSIVDLSWSPDGRRLAYARGISPVSGTYELWLTSASDGKSYQLTDGRRRESSPTWTPDARSLYFVSNRRGTPDLWKYTLGGDGVPDGEPQQVTAGIEMIHAMFCPDGKRLAYTKGRTTRNAFRAPVLVDRPATWADITQLTFDEAAIESIAVARDGRLIVDSDRGGNWDLWTLSASGRDMQQLTMDPALDAGPRWSPGGTDVLFYSSRTGYRQVWVMPAGGGPARQVTHGDAESWYPAWSPDGLNVAVRREAGLFIVPVQGGAERRLTNEPGHRAPDWSPDGRWVAFTANRDGTMRLWRVPAAGGPVERLTNGAAYTPRWSADGKQIFSIGYGDRANNVWVLSVGNRQERPVTALAGRYGTLGLTGLATDGRSVYFTWEERHGDIWVADVVQPPGK